ncbi:hypothetical protein G9A89_004020 [Geosiphon pyriformis]|nr:hypothetical protein G9A89_004020 [Geosiphon pyriformis]
MIDYIFVGGNLSSTVAGHQVVFVSDFFDTDHKAVVVSVGLGGLLDVQLNSLRKQANKDRWKFKIRNADCVGWAKFKDLSSAKLLSLGEVFSGAEIHGDVDAMWAVLVGAVVDSADVTFSRHWFSEFKCSRNKHSSRFFGLELLVAKIVKKFCSGDLLGTDRLVSKWSTLDLSLIHISWVSRNQHRALLYTLPVGTNAHDLSNLLESYGGKTCYIGRNPSSYVRDRCAVICFGDEASKLAAIGTVPVFRNVSLHWAGLFLASCAHCKQFGHVSVNCSLGVYSGVRRRRVVSEQDRVCLAGIYKKKSAPVVCPVSFGGKTWAQVAGSSLSRIVSSGAPGVSLVSGSMAFSMDSSSSGATDLGGRLAMLECSVKILSDQVSLILKKLSFVDLVPLASFPSALPLVSPTAVVSDMNPGLELDGTLLSSAFSSPNVGESVVNFSPSSSKVLTAKIGGLESNMMALEASVHSVLDRLDHLHSGSGSLAFPPSQ